MCCCSSDWGRNTAGVEPGIEGLGSVAHRIAGKDQACSIATSGNIRGGLDGRRDLLGRSADIRCNPGDLPSIHDCAGSEVIPYTASAWEAPDVIDYQVVPPVVTGGTVGPCARILIQRGSKVIRFRTAAGAARSIVHRFGVCICRTKLKAIMEP